MEMAPSLVTNQHMRATVQSRIVVAAAGAIALNRRPQLFPSDYQALSYIGVNVVDL